VQFPFHKTTLLQREQNTIPPFHGNGEATESWNVLLILMKTSSWPRSADQVNVTLIPSGIPPSKMKTVLVLWSVAYAELAVTTW
jgi:RNA polymerase subunit RPABC4/transcription elongation factor Spt4